MMKRNIFLLMAGLVSLTSGLQATIPPAKCPMSCGTIDACKGGFKRTQCTTDCGPILKESLCGGALKTTTAPMSPSNNSSPNTPPVSSVPPNKGRALPPVPQTNSRASTSGSPAAAVTSPTQPTSPTVAQPSPEALFLEKISEWLLNAKKYDCGRLIQETQEQWLDKIPPKPTGYGTPENDEYTISIESFDNKAEAEDYLKFAKDFKANEFPSQFQDMKLSRIPQELQLVVKNAKPGNLINKVIVISKTDDKDPNSKTKSYTYNVIFVKEKKNNTYKTAENYKLNIEQIHKSINDLKARVENMVDRAKNPKNYPDKDNDIVELFKAIFGDIDLNGRKNCEKYTSLMNAELNKQTSDIRAYNAKKNKPNVIKKITQKLGINK